MKQVLELRCVQCGVANAEFDLQCLQCGEPLSEAGTSVPSDSSKYATAVRRRVGPYELLEPLGRGGMGQVYRARRFPRGRLVALKTVTSISAAVAEGLRREVRALSKLRHPGIVHILAHGVSEEGPWYAMELESLVALAVAKLRRAVEAFEAGEHHLLFRGQLIQDIPEGLRRWLRETGQLQG